MRKGSLVRRNFLSLAVSLAVSLAAVVAGCIGNDETPRPAPDFTVTAVDGKEYTLSDWKGKPVVLFFMAEWCPTCHTYSRGPLQEIWQKVNGSGGLVLSLDIAPFENGSNLESFQKANGAWWPHAMDTDRVQFKYELRQISMAFAIDAEQRIVLSGVDPPAERVLDALGL